MEKNKLAIMYMDLRQDADVRIDLCHKYRVDPDAVRKKRTKQQELTDTYL